MTLHLCHIPTIALCLGNAPHLAAFWALVVYVAATGAEAICERRKA